MSCGHYVLNQIYELHQYLNGFHPGKIEWLNHIVFLWNCISQTLWLRGIFSAVESLIRACLFSIFLLILELLKRSNRTFLGVMVSSLVFFPAHPTTLNRAFTIHGKESYWCLPFSGLPAAPLVTSQQVWEPDSGRSWYSGWSVDLQHQRHLELVGSAGSQVPPITFQVRICI